MTTARNTAQAGLPDRVRPVVRTKRWVAIIGVLSLFLAIPSVFFWDDILAGLPVSSANFLAYRLSRILASGDPAHNAHDVVSRWRAKNPTAYGVFVAGSDNRVIFSTVSRLLGVTVDVRDLDDRDEVGEWFLAHGFKSEHGRDARCHVAHAVVRDQTGNVSARIWVVGPDTKYLSLFSLTLVLCSLPNVRMGLWNILFWLSIPIWIYLDALVQAPEERRRAWLWSMIGMAFNVAGLALYLIAHASKQLSFRARDRTRG